MTVNDSLENSSFLSKNLISTMKRLGYKRLIDIYDKKVEHKVDMLDEKCRLNLEENRSTVSDYIEDNINDFLFSGTIVDKLLQNHFKVRIDTPDCINLMLYIGDNGRDGILCVNLLNKSAFSRVTEVGTKLQLSIGDRKLLVNELLNIYDYFKFVGKGIKCIDIEQTIFVNRAQVIGTTLKVGRLLQYR